MEIKNYFLVIFSLILLFSCEENEEPAIDADNLLIGTWTDAIYNSEEQTTSFNRVADLPSEKYAVSFKSDQNFTERTSGWCGTPPLTYFDIEGSFTLQESSITINVESYPSVYYWRIIKLTENELVIKREVSEQEADHQNLIDLFNELSELANSEACNNSADWKFTAYGSKACGGPQGFISYSTKIDVSAFLKKIEEYTVAEDNFNKKWGVVSTCDLPAQPKSVVCENGYPTLKY
jgi:hypothetical protein